MNPRFVSFAQGERTSSYGVILDQDIIDLGARFSREAPDLRTLIAKDLLGEAVTYAQRENAGLALSSVRLLPVIPNPGTIYCIGLNYREHVEETGRTESEHPTVFLRTAQSQVGHGDTLLKPTESDRFDYEGEIAVIIGKPGRRIDKQHALEHVAGYACYNDGSARDWQAKSSQWTAGKNFPATGAFGPWMVLADTIKPGQSMTLDTKVNGLTVQSATTAQMIHAIDELIAWISIFSPLQPGDVIVSGTPGGVGARRTPPVFLQPGDEVEVVCDAIGTLRNTVAHEQ